MGVTPKTAWFMARRIRKAHEDQTEARPDFPVETGETYMGGKYAGTYVSKKPRMVGAGTRDRPPPVSSVTFRKMIRGAAEEGQTAYKRPGSRRRHKVVSVNVEEGLCRRASSDVGEASSKVRR